MGLLLRCNSYYFDNDAAYFSSSPLSANSANTGNNRANFSRLPIPFSWLNDQPREKVLEQTNEMAPDVPTTEIQEEKILNVPELVFNFQVHDEVCFVMGQQFLHSSSTSMGFHLEFGDCPHDSRYFSRSQSSMARRGSKDITAAYHMRQSSYGCSSPDSDDAASVKV
ncbi:hypothetical protein RhiirB3_501546 [Rhizophagus irregularis]|nr:hypothetical protein RhiirB3_501546 [Rhizophagus irregularis]